MTKIRSAIAGGHWRWLLLALLVMFYQSGVAAPGEDTTGYTALNPNWKLVSDRKGIKVYMRHNDESRLKTFRGVTHIKLKDEYALVALLNDYKSYPQWLHFVDGATEFARKGPLHRYLRFTTTLPWPLKDREAVLRADVVQKLDPNDPSKGSVMVYLRNRPNLIPPNPDYVRFPQMNGIFGARRLGNNEVEVIYQLVLDPGGYIPAWIANILLRDAPYFTLLRMRRIIQRPEYHDKYYNYIDLHGPGRPADAHPWEPGDDPFAGDLSDPKNLTWPPANGNNS